jgi:hypothetical protein
MKALENLMRPPARPSETPEKGGWEAVEATLGFALPEDYKEFISTYGTGAVDGFLWVLNPFSKNQHLNLINQGTVRLDAQRRFAEDSGITTPYALHPDADGLFPWGLTDNGDVLYWLCKGAPSSWFIVVCDSRASYWEEFNFSTTEFLASLITRQIVVDVFPDDFPSESPEYVVA